MFPKNVLYEFCKEFFSGNYENSIVICLTSMVEENIVYSNMEKDIKHELHKEIEAFLVKCIIINEQISYNDITFLTEILSKYDIVPINWFCKILVAFIANESFIQNLSISKSFISYCKESFDFFNEM